MNDDLSLDFNTKPLQRSVEAGVRSLDSLDKAIAMLGSASGVKAARNLENLQNSITKSTRHSTGLLVKSAQEVEQAAKIYQHVTTNFGKQLAAADRGAGVTSIFEATAKRTQKDIRELQSVIEAGSRSVLGQMSKFYSQLEQVQGNIAHTRSGTGISSIRTQTQKDFRELREAIEAETAKTLAQYRKTYAQIEQVQDNIARTRSAPARSLGRERQGSLTQSSMGSLLASDEASKEYQRSMGDMAAYYRSLQSTLPDVTAQVKQATTAATGLYTSLSTFRVVNPQITKLGSGMRSLGDDMGYTHSMARGLASGFNLLWLTWGQLAPLFIGAAISNGFMQTAKSGMEVAHTLKTIEVLGENTTAQMGALTDELLRLTKTGPMGLKELSSGMKTLSLAGLRADDITAVMSTVQNFAIAGTTSIDTAAEVLMAVTKAFGMGSAGFSRAADVISKAAADSMSSVESFAEAMKTATVVGAQYGVSLEDMAVQIAALSNLGIQGSAAGTAVRNLYADLSGRSTKVANILKEVGIEVRETSGNFKPLLEVVGELDAKLRTMKSGRDAANLMQAIFSERGGKPIVEMLRQIRTEVGGTGEDVQNALAKARKSIDESYGFTTIAAAKMNMSVSKQFEALGATLSSSMFQAFKAMEPQLTVFAVQMREALGSPEFVSALTTLTSGIATLASVIAENIRVLSIAAAGYLALTVAKQGMLLVDQAIVAWKTRGTLAIQAQTLALQASTLSTQASTAAAGANAAAMTAQAAAGTGLVATMGRAGTALALFLRVLPGVNVALAVGTAAWLMYSTLVKKSGDAGLEAANVYTSEVGKRLKQEADDIEAINKLLLQNISLEEARKRVKGGRDTAAALDPLSAQLQTLRQERRQLLDSRNSAVARANQYGEGAAENSQAVKLWNAELEKNSKKIAENAAARARILEDTRRIQEGEKTAAQVEARRLAKEAEDTAKLFQGIGEFTQASAGRGPETWTNNYTAALTDNIAALEKQGNAAVSAAKKVQANRLAILEAQKSAEIISAGEHQAGVIAATVEAEEKITAARRKTLETVEAEHVKHSEFLAQQAMKEVANSKLVGKELEEYTTERYTKLAGDIEKLNDKRVSSETTAQNEIVAITEESARRRELAEIKHQGVINKIRKSAVDYWRKISLGHEAQADQDSLADRWRFIPAEAALGLRSLKALKDSEYAAAAAAAKHREEISRLELEMAEAGKSADDLQAKLSAATPGSEAAKELGQSLRHYQEQAGELAKTIAASRKKADTDVAKVAADTYKRSMQDSQDQITKELASGITQAIFQGGKEGSKTLRDTLEEALKKPFRITIEAAVQKIADNFLNSITSGLSSWLGGSSNPYLSAIGKWFGGGGSSGSGIMSSIANYFGGGSAAASSAYGLGGAAASGTGFGVSAGGSGYGLTLGNSGYGAAAQLGAQSGAAAGTSAASSWMASASAYAGWVALAVGVANNLYDKGWNENALGKQYDQFAYGRYSRTSGTSTGGTGLGSSGNIGVFDAKFNKSILKAIGFSEKWSQVLSGMSVMANSFGRKLKGYGYEVNVGPGGTGVGGYEYHKGGLFRSNKTIKHEVDQQDAAAIAQQFQGLQTQIAALAPALGGSREAVEAYTGSIRINMKGAETAAEQNERVAESLSKYQDELLKAAGVNKEQAQAIFEQVNATMEQAGLTASSIADVLVQGMTGRLSESQVGEQLSEIIIGGIYNSIAMGPATMIAEAFTSQIITPLLTAAMMGAPLAGVVSQAAIQSVVQTAINAVNIINSVFNDPAFQQAIAEVESTIKTISKISVKPAASVRRFSAAVTSTGDAAAEAARERFGIETELLTLLGKTDVLRQRELNSLKPANRELKIRVYALEDAKSAVERALEAVERAIDTQLDVTNEIVDNLKSIFDFIQDEVRDLRSEVEQTAVIQAEQGWQIIHDMVAGIRKLEQEPLETAVSSVRDRMANTRYATAFDRDKDVLTLALELEKLSGVVEPQLTAAEQTVKLLEQQLEEAKKQVDALFGVQTAVHSVSVAIDLLHTSMAAYTAEIAKASSIAVSMTAPASSSSTAKPSGGGGGSAPRAPAKPAAAPAVWTAASYAAKNPDLVEHYNRDRNKKGWPAELPTLEAYLKWHWDTYGAAEKRQFATGGAFTNGIVRRPTLFNIGEMGEAGDEGILPLANVGGKLGVHATSSDSELKELMQEVVRELQAMRDETRATAIATGRTQDLLERVSQRGNAIAVQTLTDRPLETREI